MSLNTKLQKLIKTKRVVKVLKVDPLGRIVCIAWERKPESRKNELFPLKSPYVEFDPNANAQARSTLGTRLLMDPHVLPGLLAQLKPKLQEDMARPDPPENEEAAVGQGELSVAVEANI